MNAVGIKAHGWEISQWAVDNAMHPGVKQADITRHSEVNKTELVIAYDLLEHIPYEKLPKAIENLKKSCKKYLLVSVPVLGDPNLEADPTHIIKESKDWWLEQFTSVGFKPIEVPAHFLFRDQLMIFKK